MKKTPRSVAFGDPDGDLDLDLAVGNWLSDGISVLMNNGNGTFALPATYAAGNAPRIAVADLNNDLILDLAAANAGDADVSVLLGNGDVSILLNNGDGTFASAVDYTAGDGGGGRVGWRKTGLTINYPWEDRLDQLVWIVE